jgi:hypothetical protein
MSMLTKKPPETPRLLLKTPEAADALAISERALWELTQPRGPIPVVRIPGRGEEARAIRYSLDDLREFIGKLKAERRECTAAAGDESETDDDAGTV